MKTLGIKIMRGPSYWSAYRKKLIVINLDLEEYEYRPTNKIDGFLERTKELIPSLQSHTCSENQEGVLFHRIEQGTWLGHVVEHVALEIQFLAGMDCGFGRTKPAGQNGVYNIIFSYEIEQAGVYAAEAAIRIVEALATGERYDLEKDLYELRRIKKRYGTGPSTTAIIKEAEKRNIPFRRVNNSSLVVFGYGHKQKSIRASIAGTTSSIAVDIAGDKNETKEILAQAHIPVPLGKLIYSIKDLEDAIQEIGFPVVVKPLDGNHGRGITTNVNSLEKAGSSFQLAKQISRGVIIEKFIEGYDFRFLVINYKLIAVAQRTPAMVIGNGTSTIKELIKETNKDPKRGDGHENVLTKIKVDEISRAILHSKNFTLSSVLPIGEILFLKDTANLSTGGTSTDVTDKVHPYTVFLAERIARILNLDICGIDVVTKDVSVPLTKQVGGIVEVNACPGLRMHLKPTKGRAINVAEPIMDMLFPKNESGRIPIIAVTGTNGKTTTTRLIAHIAKEAGYKVGYTTTDGIYIEGHVIQMGDCTGPKSTQTVLSDPGVNMAVLECARGGILRSGLGFDNCDISIITNISEDHLGLSGINTIEELAKVKSVVAKTTFDDGYTILNADDDLVYDMRNDVDCNVALFSMHANNKRIRKHCRAGGMAAIIEKNQLIICKGEWKTSVAVIDQIPLTINGAAQCMVQNLLPAVLAAVIQGFNLDVIRKALRSFIPSAEQTPGRMNIFDFKKFKVMVDYAHNPDGLKQLKKFMSCVNASQKLVVVAATGDRRDEDIKAVGKLCSEIFDEIIIKHDKDLRGRTTEQVTLLLMEGIYSGRNVHVKVVSDEKEAINQAISGAKENSFITILADDIFGVINQVQQAMERYLINLD